MKVFTGGENGAGTGLLALPAFRDPAVRSFSLATLALTTCLYYWLSWLRSDVFDPADLLIFWRLFVFQDYWAAMLMVPVLLVACITSIQRFACRLVRLFGRHPWPVAVITTLALACGARFAYHAHPLSMDEYSAWMQGYAFAAGRLTGQVPPQLIDWVVPAGFQGVFINVSHDTGRIASNYWPGFALLLAPFSAVGIPWILNPLLGGAVVVAVHAITMRLSGSIETAGLAVLLTVASQAFTVNAISFYSMNAHLLINLVYAKLLMDVTPKRAFLAGVLGSLALVLHNPVPHILFGAPWLVWVLCVHRKRRISTALLAGYFPLSLVLGVGWPLLGAKMFGSEMMVVDRGDFLSNWLGKMDQAFALPSSAILYARLVGLAKLWLWAVPGLLLLAVAGWWRGKRSRPSLLLGLSAMATLVGFLFVPFDQGHGWGFRYFHSAWATLPILAATAVSTEREGPTASIKRDLVAIRPLFAALAMVWLIVGTPLRIFQVEGFISGHLAQLPAPEYGPAPVRIANPVNGYYAYDLVQSDPFLRGQVVFVTHGRDRDARMMQAGFPDLERKLSVYRGQVWDKKP